MRLQLNREPHRRIVTGRVFFSDGKDYTFVKKGDDPILFGTRRRFVAKWGPHNVPLEHEWGTFVFQSKPRESLVRADLKVLTTNRNRLKSVK